jgi:uncharacterized protein (TIGR03086 family)
VSSDPADLALLAVALDQAAGLLGRVEDGRLTASTPCADWSLGDLVDHLVNTPSVFTTIMRGQEPDWGVPPPHVGADRAARFREAGDDLVEAWRATDEGDQPSPLAWQLAELAVHTWDLARALGSPTGELDPAIAERGLSFMQAGLTADNRAPVFAPEQPAPPDADAYDRIAAFAGREV